MASRRSCSVRSFSSARGMTLSRTASLRVRELYGDEEAERVRERLTEQNLSGSPAGSVSRLAQRRDAPRVFPPASPGSHEEMWMTRAELQKASRRGLGTSEAKLLLSGKVSDRE